VEEEEESGGSEGGGHGTSRHSRTGSGGSPSPSPPHAFPSPEPQGSIACLPHLGHGWIPAAHSSLLCWDVLPKKNPAFLLLHLHCRSVLLVAKLVFNKVVD
jgi:hypothetical protein